MFVSRSLTKFKAAEIQFKFVFSGMDEGKADEPGGADDKEILEIAKLISPEFEVCTFV